MKNILIVHQHFRYPMRATTWEHLYAFKRYSPHRVFYLNLAHRKLPWYIGTIKFDLIVFHTLFITNHWGGARQFDPLKRKCELLKRMSAVKVALPQDEFVYTDLIGEFINEFGIDVVFSVAPPSEWPAIYSKVDFDKVQFHQVLTGYLDDATVARIDRLAETERSRDIDIGYRVSGKPYFWFGRHGFLKQDIAEVFAEKAPAKGLKVDISTRNQDALLGDKWYEFLLRCKSTIGVEGGTSIQDRDGSIKLRTEAYVARHPQARFEEVEAACFPNLDGTFRLFALSPRHLEACATRTCQVLTEGEYSGVLEPGKHYIELNRDFSNLDTVLEQLKQDEVRAQITERAYQDIVASGRYTYRRFVEFVTERSCPDLPAGPVSSFRRIWTRMIAHWMQWADAVGWGKVYLHSHTIVPLRNQIKALCVRTLPEEKVLALRKALGR